MKTIKRLCAIFDKLKPERFFLLFGIPWGIAFLFINPPMQVPDEPAHFLRIYQISEGGFMPEIVGDSLGGTLPKAMSDFNKIWEKAIISNDNKFTFEDFRQAFPISPNDDERTYYLFPNTAFYSPLAYLPQIVGVFAGRIFHLPLLLTFYLGRIFILTVWIILIYIAIKRLPVLKWLFLALALNPMHLYLAASLSADTLINATAFLFISVILKSTFSQETNWPVSTFVLIIVLGIMLGILKHAYVLITLLWFIIPVNRFNNRRDYQRKTLTFFGVVFVFALANMLLLNYYVETIDFENLSGNILGIQVISPHKQLQFVISHPGHFLNTLLKSFWVLKESIITSYIGLFGWWQHPMPKSIIWLIVLVQLFLALTNSNQSITVSLFQKIIIAVSLAGVIFIFSLLLYLEWKTVGADLLTEIHGRYFIPVFTLFWLLFYNKKIRLNDCAIKTVAVSTVVIASFVSIHTMIISYF